MSKKEPMAQGFHIILLKLRRASSKSAGFQSQRPPKTTAGAFFPPVASWRTASGASTSNTLFVIGNAWRVPMVNAETGSQGLRGYECCIALDAVASMAWRWRRRNAPFLPRHRLGELVVEG